MKTQSQKSALLPVPVPTVEVIVNHKSGLGNQLDFELLKSNFERFHLNAHISAARNGEEVKELARRARKGDSKVVVAAGGDGTVSAVASELAGTDKVLAILPRGTRNHFAKDLNLPLDLESAVRTIAAGHNKRVDIGEINGHTFINNSSLGLYPSIVSERQKKQRLGFRKWPAFLWAAFTVLRRYPFLDVKLTIDGAEFRSRTPFVFVGNNEYQMESFQIGARTCLDAGELSLYITHRKGRLGLLRLVLLALLGRLRTEKDFIALCTEEIWIDTHRRVLRVALDGEVQTMTPPLHYRVRPLALRVIVPNNQS